VPAFCWAAGERRFGGRRRRRGGDCGQEGRSVASLVKPEGWVQSGVDRIARHTKADSAKQIGLQSLIDLAICSHEHPDYSVTETRLIGGGLPP
jgi:hypothetical protein